MTKSNDLFAKARRLMPGGVSSPVRAYGAVGGSPPFIVSGSGSRITDADGKTYIDLVQSWGALILGHAQASVVSAITKVSQLGTSFGAPTEREVELAEIVTRAVPSVEMVRFVSSGTEATMSAIRLARAATRRKKIVKFAGCYHGHVDGLLVAAGSGQTTLGLPDSPGVTEGSRADTVVATFNSLASVREAFDRFGDEIAAVIVEPIAANMGVVPPAQSFLEELRKLCDDAPALLIFDEVITGFRVGWSGAQGMFGVLPDLTIFGKVIGGGMPVGAYGGNSELMEMIAPSGPVYQAGTLSGNPISLAAGIATLLRLRTAGDAYERLDAIGRKLEEGLVDSAKNAGVAVTVQRVGSMVTPFFVDQEVTDFQSAKRSDTDRYARFLHRMLDEGVYLPPSQFEAMFLGLAHTEEDVDHIVDAAHRAFERMPK